MAIVCLLFIRYFEVELDYRLSPQLLYVFACIYEFLAIPGFYFFTGSYLTFLIIMYLNIKLPLSLCRKIKYFISLSILLFVVFSFANILKIINIHFPGFVSIYTLIFTLLGSFFAIITNKEHKDKERGAI